MFAFSTWLIETQYDVHMRVCNRSGGKQYQSRKKIVSCLQTINNEDCAKGNDLRTHDCPSQKFILLMERSS